jgi:glutathione S-transferase
MFNHGFHGWTRIGGGSLSFNTKKTKVTKFTKWGWGRSSFAKASTFAEPAADKLREAARDRVRERILLIERAAAGPFILQSGFSILDIYAAMFARWSIGRQWREANIPRLNALSDAVSRRPAIAPVWARHFPRPQA